MDNERSITPEMSKYETLHPFRQYCQKVLPTVYDDSLSYYELLCKVVDYLNKTMENTNGLHTDITKLYEYIKTYFTNLNVQQEINNKLDALVNDGTITGILNTMKYGNALYVGNSYCAGVGSESNKGIYDLTKHLFNNTWLSQDGGAGFIPYENHDNYFNSMIEYQANHMTNDEKISVNYVFFVSAIGDTRALIQNNYSITNTLTELNRTVIKAKELFPNAQICVAFAESVINGYGDTDAQAQLRFNKMLKENSSNIGYRYLGWIGWNTNHYSGFNATDNYHPNDRGYRNLKNNFINSFTGSFNIVPKKTNISIGDFGKMELIYTDELLTLKLNQKSGLNVIKSETELIDLNNKNIGIVPYSVYGNIFVTLFEPGFVGKGAYISVNNGRILLTPFNEINTKNGYYCFDVIEIPLV